MLEGLGQLGRRLQRRHPPAVVRERLLDVVRRAAATATSSMPLQGSGTFSVEAAVATLVPKDGHVLVLDNGAYCKRAAKLTQMMGRRATVMPFAEDGPVSAAALDDRLRGDASVTHVILVHCETGTGVENPLADVAAVCERHGRGLIVDAMSSFAALPIDARRVRFDALVAASGKCLEGVPGMGFVFVRKAVLDACAGNSQSLAMDLHDQHAYMERTGQWRFTPPTHVVAALAAALDQFVEEGGQPARAGALPRTTATTLVGNARLPLRPASRLPAARDPGTDHRHVPRARRTRRTISGASTRRRRRAGSCCIRASCSRRSRRSASACIGAIGRNEMTQAVAAVGAALREMGIASGAPAH